MGLVMPAVSGKKPDFVERSPSGKRSKKPTAKRWEVETLGRNTLPGYLRSIVPLSLILTIAMTSSLSRWMKQHH